jgi:hypothetical protein
VVNTNNSVGFLVASGSSSVDLVAVATPASVITAGQWFFLAGWNDTTTHTINIQVNNGPIYSTPYSLPVFQGVGTLYFGGSEFGGSFDGLMDEFQFYRRALTADERTFLYNGGAGRKYSDISPVIVTTTLPSGVAGDAYSQQLQADGSTGIETWLVISGTLPSGVTVSSSGLLSGVPPSPVGSPFNFTVKMMDEAGAYDTQALTLTIVAAPVVPPTYKGTFEIIPARKSLTLIRAVTRSHVDAQLDFSVHKTKTIDVTGIIDPPIEPMMMQMSFDGMSTQMMWTPSPTEAVSGYVITDESDRYVAQTSGKALTYAEPAQADQVTRRVYAVSSSGVLSSGYAEATWVPPLPASYANVTGVEVDSDGIILTKTAPDGWGNAGAIIDKKILTTAVPVTLSATPDRTDVEDIFGFSDIDTPLNIEDFTVAIWLRQNGQAMWVRKAGNPSQGPLGKYSKGDEFEIEVIPNVQDPQGVPEVEIHRYYADKRGLRDRKKVIEGSGSGHIGNYIGIAIKTAGGVSDLRLRISGVLGDLDAPLVTEGVRQNVIFQKPKIVGKNKALDIPKFKLINPQEGDILTIDADGNVINIPKP